MPYPLISRRYKIITAIALLGLMAACAPLSAPVSNGSNLNLEMRRMQATITGQEQELSKFALRVGTLEGQLQQLEQELGQLRQGATGAQASEQKSSLSYTVPPASSHPQEQGDGSPTEVYLRAFGDYASGRYQAAISGFETFLQRFPGNAYASNARYWLADCYFNQQEYPTAILEFQKVLNDYPRAVKSPDALLKIATSQLQLGRTDEARQAVGRLDRQFPKSTAAQKAQELALP